MDEDVSGLTFEEWDPSSDTDDSQDSVETIVNTNELCAVDFDLREVIPLQLESRKVGKPPKSPPNVRVQVYTV